jgi:hypothetical protein
MSYRKMIAVKIKRYADALRLICAPHTMKAYCGNADWKRRKQSNWYSAFEGWEPSQ